MKSCAQTSPPSGAARLSAALLPLSLSLGLALTAGLVVPGCHRSPPPIGNEQPQVSGPPAPMGGGQMPVPPGPSGPPPAARKMAGPLPPGAAEKGELPVGHPPVAGGGPAAPPPGGAEELKAPVEQKSVTGTITASPDVEAKVASGDVIYVFARGPVPGPPLAAKKLTVSKLPMEFSLGPGEVMPGSAWTGKVSIVARVAKGGDAFKKPGDIEGAAKEPVDVGATGVAVVLDKVL